MKIFITIQEEQPQSVLECIGSDYRVKFYNDYILCLGYDVNDLEREYNIYGFCDCVNNPGILLDLFDVESVLDLTDMCYEDLKSFPEEYLLFYNNFTKWMKLIKNYILSNHYYLISNWESCSGDYKEFLNVFANTFYERGNNDMRRSPYIYVDVVYDHDEQNFIWRNIKDKRDIVYAFNHVKSLINCFKNVNGGDIFRDDIKEFDKRLANIELAISKASQLKDLFAVTDKDIVAMKNEFTELNEEVKKIRMKRLSWD